MLEKYYHQHNIPAGVYIPFLRMCNSARELEELKWHGPLSPEIRKAIESQQLLSNEFLLRGYLTIDWLSAIQENHSDKLEVLLTHLYLGLWNTLFASIWEQRNLIAHSDASKVTKIEREKTN